MYGQRNVCSVKTLRSLLNATVAVLLVAELGSYLYLLVIRQYFNSTNISI